MLELVLPCPPSSSGGLICSDSDQCVLTLLFSTSSGSLPSSSYIHLPLFAPLTMVNIRCAILDVGTRAHCATLSSYFFLSCMFPVLCRSIRLSRLSDYGGSPQYLLLLFLLSCGSPPCFLLLLFYTPFLVAGYRIHCSRLPSPGYWRGISILA